MQSFRAEAKKPHRHRSPTPDSDTDSLNSNPRSPRHKSTPIRKAKVSASAVNRRVIDLFNKNKNTLNEAATATAPTDYITTFVRHVEQDMRDQVKRHLHDEFMHDVQNLLWAFKKKPSIYVDLRTLPNYNPELPVRSFQLFPDMSLDQIRTEITVKPQATSSIASTSTATAAAPPPQQQVDSIELPEHLVMGDVRVVKKIEKIDGNSNEVYGTPNANIRIVNKNDMFDLGNVDGNLGGIDLSMENDSHQFGSV